MTLIGKERRDDQSLCEKSMLLVANIIKLSTSLSFTKMSHGTTTTPAANPATVVATAQSSGSKRLQEPQSRSKPIYVTKAGGGGGGGGGGSMMHSPPKYSSYHVQIHRERDFDEENVDGWASKYIDKVHKKNREDLDEVIIKKPFSQVISRKSATVLN